MSFSSQDRSHDGFDRNAAAIEAEKTLRLIATLPAPEGIEERLKAGLRSAPRPAMVVGWPMAAGSRNSWMHTSAMRAAAAAAIVFVVAGGGWEVYSHIRVASVPAAVVASPQISGQSGLSTAGTRRVPQTLEGPVNAAPLMVKQKVKSSSAMVAHAKTRSAKKPAASVPPQP